MNISTKLLKAAAGSAGGASLDVDDVFSIDLWDGTGRYTGTRAEQTITNGIDFSTHGGMVYIRGRSTGNSGSLFSTPELGVGNFLYTTSTMASIYDQTSNTYINTGPNQYNTDGFKLGDERDGWSAANDISTPDYVGFSFRKAPKFFDAIQYSGTGSGIKTISHNLGSAPGMMIVKKTSGAGNWLVWHKDLTNTHDKYFHLNDTAAEQNYDNIWGPNGYSPTSTEFKVQHIANESGTYVAYLFANNNSDGEFGPSADQDIINVGSFSGSSSSDVTVNLGFEPQWLLTRRTGGGNWNITDNMRGLVTGGIDPTLYADSSSAENTAGDRIDLTPTGFIQKSGQTGNETVIYMAIRRGPLAAPTDATKVFAIDGETDTSPTPPTFNSGFPVDFWMGRRNTAGVDTWYLYDRLRQDNVALSSNLTDAEFTAGGSYSKNDRNDGIGDFATVYYANSQAWMWKRAPGYFDVVAYQGTGSATTVPHGLTVPPEMIWVKSRSHSVHWAVYHKDLSAGQYLRLNKTNGVDTNSAYFTTTAPTSSVFSIGVGEYTNQSSSHTYIAYLFATVPNVSCVGSYTGTGNSNITVDCGFSSGARFVLIKRTDASGSWWIADTVRGLVSGNDSLIELNGTGAQITNYNMVEPSSSGFIVNGGANKDNSWNDSGGTYIFYAIA